MSPNEYAKKHPLITIVAKATRTFGQPVGIVAKVIAGQTGFKEPHINDNVLKYLDSLEAHLESIRY